MEKYEPGTKRMKIKHVEPLAALGNAVEESKQQVII